VVFDFEFRFVAGVEVRGIGFRWVLSLLRDGSLTGLERAEGGGASSKRVCLVSAEGDWEGSGCSLLGCCLMGAE